MKHLFATDRETRAENHNQSKCRVVEPSHMICYTIAPPKAQGSLGRGGWKDCKSQRIRELAERLCLLGMSEPHSQILTNMIATTHKWTGTTLIEMLMVGERKAHRVSTLHKVGNTFLSGSGEHKIQ